MKLFTSLVIAAVAGYANAHYKFDYLVVNGEKSKDPVRLNLDGFPVYTTEFPSPIFYCNDSPSPAKSTKTVAPGDQVGFYNPDRMWHPGPGYLYLGKVPEGKTLDSWDGSGKHWAKIAEWGPVTPETYPLNFKLYDKYEVISTLPASTPPGDYLLRVEHVNVDSGPGYAQFYIGCAQITVTGNGTGTPGPLVDFWEYIDPTDPNLTKAYSNMRNYTLQGPPLWVG